MLTELASSCLVEEIYFEEGKTYTYYLRNKTTQEGCFALSDMVSPYGGTMVVCKPDGSKPPKAETPEGWTHGILGDFERARYLVEEGDYIIHVHTPTGFDVLLETNTEQPLNPLVTISKIIKLENLEVFGSMEMVVTVQEKFYASELSYHGEITNAVIDAINRVC